MIVMLLYNPIMANTKSAKKNIRSSAKKKAHNDMWEARFKSAKKSLSKSISAGDKAEVVKEKFIALQKSLDKAAKEKVIHKNKANRVKSNYARKITALSVQGEEEPKSKSSSKKSAKPSKKK
jgi:small subunit ribosomal protein S20